MLKLFLLSQPSETPLLKARLLASANPDGEQHKLVERVRFAPLGEK